MVIDPLLSKELSKTSRSEASLHSERMAKAELEMLVNLALEHISQALCRNAERKLNAGMVGMVVVVEEQQECCSTWINQN